MVIKEMSFMNHNYIIGFKEFKTYSGTLLECHILKKFLFWHTTIYKKSSLKGLNPDYKNIALFTIIDYEEELKQQEQLISAEW